MRKNMQDVDNKNIKLVKKGWKEAAEERGLHEDDDKWEETGENETDKPTETCVTVRPRSGREREIPKPNTYVTKIEFCCYREV